MWKMSVRLFICLVFIVKIVSSDYQTTSQNEASSTYRHYNQRNIRKIVTESLNDSAGGAAENINKTENKTNGTGNNITVVPLIKDQDKNGTVTNKPEANKEEMETQSSQIVNSYPPYSSYQVTENVIDIPDDRTPVGPIDTSYTHQPPILNLARPTNKTDTDKITEAGNIKTKKNCLSILHINAEFDDKDQHKHKVGLLKGIKAYIHNFQKSFVNGLHSFFHKHHDEHEHEHGHWDRFERTVGNDEGRAVSNGVQNVDKTDYNVRGRHVSLT